MLFYNICIARSVTIIVKEIIFKVSVCIWFTLYKLYTYTIWTTTKKKLQFEHIKKHTVHIWNVLDEIQLIRTLDSHGNRAKRLWKQILYMRGEKVKMLLLKTRYCIYTKCYATSSFAILLIHLSKCNINLDHCCLQAILIS